MSLGNNIIPHTWKLAGIIPIPRPNGHVNIGASCRHITLLSVIAGKLLPCITRNIPHVSTRHGFRGYHSASTALHNTLFAPGPADCNTQLELQMDNITLPMNISPEVLVLTLDPRLTCNRYVRVPSSRRTRKCRSWFTQKINFKIPRLFPDQSKNKIVTCTTV